MTNFWLMKSEPDAFSIDDLKNSPHKTAHWDGVRNYQARNYMRDQMKKGDHAFFYHSNCKTPGIVGIMSIFKEGYPDFTALDPHDPHYDPRSTGDNPRWYMVDVRYIRSLKRVIGLNELKQYDELKNMPLVQRGNRLSVMPVTAKEWQFVVDLE
jgi:predicted RNA-binding protein with PUA-like domain